MTGGLHRRALLAGAAGLAAPLVTGARAETRAGRPATLIVPFAAGGAADIIGRAVADRLGGPGGRSVVVENRPGAGSNAGLAAVARGEPDGSLFGLASIALAVNPALYRTIPFDPVRDLTPLTLALETPNVVIVQAGSPHRTLAGLASAAKAGSLSYGSAGIGSSLHLAALLFCRAAGVTMTHVPYRGTAPAMTDLMGGRIDAIFDNASTAIPQVQGGTVRAIAVTTAERVAALPEIATVAEQGFPGAVLSNWWAFVGPGALQPPAAARLGDDLRAALADDATRRSVETISGRIVASDAATLRAHLAAEIARWRGVIADAGIAPT